MSIPSEAFAIVEEETLLLEQVRAALARKRPAGRHDPRDLVERLEALREDAAKAAAHDLPTLFQEMSLVRAMLERTSDPELPDAETPYFAHLRLEEAGTERDFCLGRKSFFDTLEGVRILDWRYAPVASLFYRYREGDTYEVALPGRVAEGRISARRVVVIHGGRLARIVTPDFALRRDGDGWTLDDPHGALLAGGAGTATRAIAPRGERLDISALLDAEQFEAIRESPDRGLLVLGGAGSGKTTVALHRLASLAFERPGRFPPERMEVVVPEPGLARLSRRLLDPLGLSRVRVRTLDVWAKDTARRTFRQPALRLCEEAPPLVSGLKRHPALFHLLRRELMRGRSNRHDWRGLKEELGDLLTDRVFLGGVVERASGEVPLTAIEETVRHTMAQLAHPSDHATAALEGYDAVDGRPLDEGTPVELAGTTDVEDLPILLFMHAWRTRAPALELRSHLVVDEAEDLSLFELHALGRSVGDAKSVTLAGDEAQQTFTSFGGWEDALAALGAPGATVCRLQTTYRCPEPIAALARRTLGPLAPAIPPRPGHAGPPVGRFDFPMQAQASLFLVDALRELVDREPHASVGVIAHSREGAETFHRLLADLPEARLVVAGEFSFEPGIDVTCVSAVKGLEFDYVVIPDLCARHYPDQDEARRRLHVAVTRASHQLWLVTVGTPSPIVPPP